MLLNQLKKHAVPVVLKKKAADTEATTEAVEETTDTATEEEKA